jgi:5'-3' exonuclease
VNTLLLDGQNICYREAYAKAGLSYKSKPTNVIYGFLQQVRHLMYLYPGEIHFCWDNRESLRKQFYPAYKANRKRDDLPEEVKDAFIQIEELRTNILPRLGLNNHHHQSGYEADDLIAVLCKLPGKSIIVSSDNDLFQCLGPTVSIHNIGKKVLMNYKQFQVEFKVTPQQWIEVKALCGDSSDNIEGIAGVGVVTATKIVLGQQYSKKLKKKVDAFDGLERNRKLIRLPWEGTKPGDITRSCFNEREFIRVCGEYGLESLIR